MFLAILLTSLALPILAPPANAQPTREVTEEGGWKKIVTDVITVRFPVDGRKPMFLWWYNEEPDMIYVVKFQGLIEYFTFDRPYYQRRYQASADNLDSQFIKPKWTQLRQEMREAIINIYKNWHPPFLPFSLCRWKLSEEGAILDSGSGEEIGYAFAFKLDETSVPSFEFAENSITIRCRFYYEAVKEIDVDGIYQYGVGENEMKMDFVVENWKWNIGVIRPLLADLEEHGIEIPERESRLALWINLASIDLTKIIEAWIKPEDIESWSISSYMIFDGQRMFVRPDYTDQLEKPWDVGKRLHDYFKLQFADEDKTLAGFFRFIASAKVSGESKPMPVTASYIEAGNHMRLFIGYPYFDGTLEHDPSIGVEVPETTAPEATTPKYTVEIPSGSQVVPRVIERIGPQFVTPELVIALVVVVSTIAIAAFAAKRRGKIVNVVGVK